jgi:hypothetical protein
LLLNCRYHSRCANNCASTLAEVGTSNAPPAWPGALNSEKLR